MSVKGQAGGAHHTSTDTCNASDRNATTSSMQLKPEAQAQPTTSTGDMGGEHKFPRSSREMRNMAEKMRRDKLNHYINELANIVPHGAGGSKRLDKTSTLRLAANYIRMHKILMREDEGVETAEKVPLLLRGDIAHSLAEAVGGFLLVVTSTGRVVYVTEAVDQFFGHSQVDLLGQTIYNVIHPDDHEIFQQQLIPKDESRRSFFCRMMEKALTRNDPGRYEIIHIVGQLRPIPASSTVVPCSPASVVLSPTGRSSNDAEENYESDGEADNHTLKAAINRIGTHILVSFVRVVKDRPITELSLVESTQDEYITRHCMGGKILYTDHRISCVTGLMPGEVIGTSAFNYMHPEDRVWSIVAQKLMFTSTQGQGIVSYRLKCRDGSLVTLRSRGYLEVNKQTGQVESFVCINTVVSVKESYEEIQTQRRKLLPLISSDGTEDYLNSISSSLPPELVKEVLELLSPEMVASMGFGEANSDKITEITDASPMQLAGPSEQSYKTSTKSLKNSHQAIEDNPYQSKPKKLCSSKRSEAEFSKKRPEPFEETRDSQDESAWYNSPERHASTNDFKTVVTEKFTFEREQMKHTRAPNEHPLSPAASPQVQVSPASPQYCTNPYPSPGHCNRLVDQLNSGKGLDINNCHLNKDVLAVAGACSPYGKGSEVSPTADHYSVGMESCSPQSIQSNISIGFLEPEYGTGTPFLQDDVNKNNILFRQGEPQISPSGMPSPGSTFVRNDRNVSPNSSYPVHSASDRLLTSAAPFPDTPQDGGMDLGSSTRHHNWGNENGMNTGASSPKCTNSGKLHGHQVFQQADFGGSVGPGDQSGQTHQRNVHPQFSPTSSSDNQTRYQQQQNHHHLHQVHNKEAQLLQNNPQKQQQHLVHLQQQLKQQQQQLQQQQLKQQQLQQQQLQQQQLQQQQLQQQQLQQQQQQQLQQQQLPQQQLKQQQLRQQHLQQQQLQQQQQQQQQRHFRQHRSTISESNIRQPFNSSTPKFDSSKVQHRYLSNQPIHHANYTSAAHVQSRTGVAACHPSNVSGGSPDMQSTTTTTTVLPHIESDDSHLLQCDASFHFNTANLCQENNTGIPGDSDACYGQFAPVQGIDEGSLDTSFITAEKTYNTQFQYNSSPKNEIKDKFP